MSRRALFWMGQAVLVGAVGAFVWRSLARHWEEFRAVEVAFHPQPGWIALSALVVWATYGGLIEAWRRILAGWGERLPYATAVRIWTISNLGRYLPGKIWSVAGLAVLAQRSGVAPWAAAGSAIIMQAVALGTGVAVVAATAPGAASPLSLALAALVAACVVAVLVWPKTMRLASRALGRELRPLHPAAVTIAALVTTLSWVAYGVAFWLLARGLFGHTSLSLASAVGVFAAGYIIGLLALVAPGGVGVREVIFIGLLAPILGSGAAVALGIASRILLTITEAGAAAAGLLTRERKGASG